MRLSVYPTFAGYDPVLSLQYEAYLDGEKLEYCVAADEEAGEAVIWDLDECERLRMEAFKTVKGRVELRRLVRHLDEPFWDLIEQHKDAPRVCPWACGDDEDIKFALHHYAVSVRCNHCRQEEMARSEDELRALFRRWHGG